MRRLTLLVSALLCLFYFSASAQPLSTNAVQNDAYIDVSWSLAQACFQNAGNNNLAYPNGVYLNLFADGVSIYIETIENTMPAAVTNTFRHFVGPDKTVNYSLMLYVIGPGNEITTVNCSSLAATGGTIGFQAPEEVTATDATRVDGVMISWKNKSLLSSSFQIIRKQGMQEVLVASITGSTRIDSVFTYLDAFTLNNAQSLVNGVQYEYCIRTFSNLTNTTFSEQNFMVCDMGSTFDVGLEATDFTLANRVDLSWNDVSGFADRLVIKRNGDVIATLDDETLTAYSDTDPTYGQNSLYAIELVNAQGSILVQDTTRGGVNAIGAISGYVRTKEGIGVQGVKVRYEVQLAGSMIRDSVFTDFTGFYAFTDVFYSRQGNFSVSASRGSASIAPSKITFTLNNQTPTKSGADFRFNTNLAASTNVIAIQQFEGTQDIDKLNFTWDYTSTADTTHFQLYREGRLIAITDDGAGPPAGMSDISGKPGYYYAYELRAYSIRNDSFAVASARDTLVFPLVAQPFDFQVQANFDNNSKGVLTLTWDHASTNFSGFKIYRGTRLIATLGPAARRFSDYTGEPGASYQYMITAFRLIEDELTEDGLLGIESFESAALTSPAIQFPAFFEPLSVTATALAADNAVRISWNIPAGIDNLDYYSGFKIMRDGREVGQIMKGDTPEFLDLLGQPGASYNYMVLTFVNLPDTVYFSSGVAANPAALAFPAIATPAIASLVPATGRLQVNIDAAYNAANQNYDGFILFADGVAFDTLQRHQTAGFYYPNIRGAAPFNTTISLRAYRDINGQVFASDAATSMAAIPLANNLLEAPGNINASTEFPMHVAVTWSYPPFKLSRFVVYRDNAVLDTLPTTARAYYDYTPTPGQTHEYSVKSIFEGAESIVVSDLGRRRNLGVLLGQVISLNNSSNVDSLELRLLNGAQTVGRVFTGQAGFYLIEDLPVDGGQSSLAIQLQTDGRSVEVPLAQQNIPGAPILNQRVTRNFSDVLTPINYPPQPQRDTLAEIREVVAQPYEFQRRVAVSWTVAEGLYDGFEVYRELRRIGTVRRGEPMFLIDSTGTGGITYFYWVKPYIDANGVRTSNDGKGAAAIFPELAPVRNLTATAGYFGADNAINLNWSHRTGRVSYYIVARNEVVLGLVPAGATLTYEDKDGIPDQQYVYTVRAVLQEGSELMFSEPQTVAVKYPKVGNPKIALQAVPDSNAVRLSWAYKGAYVNGYRIYRDDALIATLTAADSFYFDLKGKPGINQEYTVVALLERAEMSYQSTGARDTITFPVLKPVLNLMATAMPTLGNANLSFDYYARGVDYFEMMYMIDYTDANNMPQDSTLMFTFFYSSLKNNKLTFVDELAIPNASIDYMVRAVSVREGVPYFSDYADASLSPYPRPPMPMNFTATKGTFDNRVELSWNTPFEANIDSFEIRRSGISIAMVPGGRRNYSDVFNQIGNLPGGSFTYTIVAYRRDYGVNFESLSASDTGWPGLLRAQYNILNDASVTSTYGWSLGAHQNIMAVGSPFSGGGSGHSSFFENINGVWSLRRSFPGSVFSLGEYGSSIDVFAGHVLVGAPGTNSNNGSFVYWDNFFPSVVVLDAGPAGARRGENVAVTGSRAYFTDQPDLPTPSRRILGFVNTSSPITSTYFADVLQQANPANQKYVSMDASDTYIVAGATTGTATEEGFVDVYKRSGNSISLLKRMDGEENGNNFGVSTAVNGDLLVVGANKKQSGRIYVYRITDSSPFLQSLQQFSPPVAIAPDADFGFSVAMSDDYLIVGARNAFDLGSTTNRTGLAYLYKRFGSSFEYVDVLNIPGGLGTNGAQFGFSVAACDAGFIVGAPYYAGRGGVFFYSIDLLELWNDRLVSVNASDGLFSSRTRVQWTFTGNRDYINGFNIYRDNELMATVGPAESVYQDTEGIPGKEYTYKVTVVTNANRESLPKSDKGFRKGLGVFEGDVFTAVGSAPVPGVLITAQAVIGGEKYVYSNLTDVSGHFYIDGVYFADETVTYSLEASFEGHDFLTNPIPVSISPENNVKSNILFIDNTAYIARGIVRHQDVTCGLDSITVRAISRFSDNTMREEVAMTNADGEYSLVLRPGLAGLTEIRIEIDSIRVRTNEMGMAQDTIRYQFVASSGFAGATLSSSGRGIAINNFNTFPREIIVDFENELKYEVEFFVTTVCGLPASSNGTFQIEISTRDGCFQTFATTGVNGRVAVNLPTLDDLILTVKGANPLTVENLLIVDYLRYRPDMIDLLALHIDNFKNNYSPAILDSLTFKKLVYHKPASIEIANEFGEAFCNDASQPRLIRQNSNYSIRFDVKEFHQGEFCSADEGYIIINNAAAQQNSRDTLQYIAALNQFEPHSFRGGEPNLVAPFRKGINAKYFSAVGDLLAEVNIPVIVLGAAPLPGSDIIVDVTDDQGQVKLPIYVLRDPPGDGSFSMIEEGQTITKSLTDIFSFKGGVGLKTDLKFAVATVGLFLEIDTKIGGSTATEDTYEMTFTTKQAISTSSTADFVGPDADVLVGIGVATQYGIVEEVRFDETNCTISKVQTFNISPNEIKTDWYYTVGQIKQLINEKRAQAAAALSGAVEVQVGGILLSKESAADRFNTEAQNWESILDYHQVQSVPYYQLCAEELNPDQLWAEVLFYKKQEEYKRGIGVFGQEVIFTPSNAPSDFRTRVQKAKDARRNFCTDAAVGSYNAQDSFILSRPLQEIVFTTGLAEKYERASRAVDYYLDSLYLSVSTVESRLASPATSSLFPQVENSTFSAGVTVEKSATVTRSTSSKVSQRGFFDFSLVLGGFLAAKASAGFGLITDIAVAENKLGGQFSLNFEWGKDHYNAQSIEATVGYTLTDDDPGDQFSVTAIRGREPGHTPYFQLLGGRSSCPPEPGTIVRDQFDISIWDPETRSTFDHYELRNQDINSTAKFYIQLTNLSPFGEQRDLFVYHEGESNTNGATLILAGQYLGGGNYDGLTYTFINPNQPFILPLEILPSPGIYEYENIQVVLRPSCTDGDLYLLGVRDTVTISVYFDYPCSDITIADPGNDWLIRRRDPFIAESREALVVELRDYDSSNPELQEVYLEYRRIGGGGGWTRIPTSELSPNYVVNIDSLAAYDAANFGPGQIPKFFFIWDITERYNQYPDGIYEVRAISFCGASGEVRSNIIRGQIRRQTGDIFAITKPSNGVWLVGDEISIRVNKELDCNRVNEMKFELKNKATGIPVPGQVFCFSDNNTLIFQPNDQILLSYDRQDLVATVYDLVDEAGNRYLDTFRWEFRVISRDIYVDDNLLRTTIYQGSQGLVSVTAFRNTPAPVGFSVENLQNYPWLSADPEVAVINSPLGRKINFTIDGSMLPIGDTSATLVILSTSGLINQGADTVRIEVKVLAKPPYWVVDPSLYSQNMSVISNFEFTDAPGVTSRDTMDLVSAWIGNRIRGVARISSTGGGLHAAFMSVFGNPADAGKPIEFRVWDASEGREYNAYPSSTDTILFASNAVVGSFLNPEILSIDKTKDRARYIPLNGNGRWTWFSINHQEPDMSVKAQLRELVDAQNGDLIKTATSSSSFVPGLGWVSVNGLNTLRPQDGYQIFLNGPDDTIRVTGMDAVYNPIALAQGWNLVGYPLQLAQPINPTLNIVGVSNNDFIKTVAQDPALPGLSANMFASYSSAAAQWLFGLGTGMELLRPNFAYQIRVAQPSALLYPGATITLTSTVADGPATPAAIACDPNDPASWAVDPGLYPSNMIAVGILEINGEQSSNPGDKVAAFINGECRGVSPLYEVAGLGQYMANLFIYGEPGDGEVEIRIYDSSADRIYLNQEPFTFSANALTGNFAQPYVFRNKLFSASFEIEHTLCHAGQDGSARISLVTGLEPPYSYAWSHGAGGAEATGLSAGAYAVTVTGQGGLWFEQEVIIQNLMQEIALPQVSASFEGPVCRGDEAAFYAEGGPDGAAYLWSDAKGGLLHEGASLVLDGLQSAFAGYVQAAYRGCYSAPAPIAAAVYQPDAGFYATPSEGITTETELQFEPRSAEPGTTWQWGFGDGSSSSEQRPAHRYAQPGLYEASLTAVDAAGCRNAESIYLGVEAVVKAQEAPAAQLSLEAWPNPFSSLLRAKVTAGEAGKYRLSLLDMEGRLIWSEGYQWAAGENEAELRLSIPDGAYLLRLDGGSGEMRAIQVAKQTPRP
jgi:hypothetical protein